MAVVHDDERKVLQRRIDWEKIGQIAYFLENMEIEYGYVKPGDRSQLEVWAEYLRKIKSDVGV